MSDLKRRLAARRKAIGTKALAKELGIPEPSLRRMLGKGKSSGIPASRQKQVAIIVRWAKPKAPGKRIVGGLGPKVPKRQKKRSEAAEKGWVTRRYRNYIKQGVSHKSALEQAEIPRAMLVQGVLARMHLVQTNNVHVLRTLIERDDKKWSVWYEAAIEFGLSPTQARTIWFSPVPTP